MGSKGSNTTTTSSSPNPIAMDAYYNLLNRASGVASTPYQAYQGDLTAPVNAQQTTGINNINQNAGFAQPYIQQAAGYATNAAQPLTQQQIQQYQSPYTQSVVDATSNWFNNQNQQQQQNVLGNAAAQGALGGDRVGVAQANLAAQQTASQAPVIAGLYNQGYQQAVGVAQQQQQNQANAAYSLGNLGVAGQNAALTGANAQVGAGSLQQQNEQQRLNALYQQYQIGQAFPYQQTQWLAGIDTGVGSQLGGNSSTTAPAPNPWAQYAGVGLTAASMFLKRGGAVPGFAPGGSVEDAPFGGVGWIPGRQITIGRGAPPPPSVGKQPDGMADLSKGMNAFAKGANQHDWGVGAPMDLSASGVAGFTPSSAGTVFSPGQFDMASSGFGGIYRDGGRIPGFAPGGTVDDMTFADRWSPAVGAVGDGTFDPQGLNSRSDNFDITPTVSDAGIVPTPRPRPDAGPQTMVAGFAPAYDDARDDAMADRADGMDQPALGFAPDQEPVDQLPGGEGALPFASIPDSPRPETGVAAGPAEAKRGFNLGLLPDNLRMPLLTAGLAMLASRSPNIGNAIGEGGLAGVGAYAQQKQAELTHAEKKQSLAQQNRRIDLDAKRLDNAAEHARRTLAETTRRNDIADKRAESYDRRADIAERRADLPPGYRWNADRTAQEPIPGGIADLANIKAAAEAKRGSAGLLDDDTVSDMAGQYLSGDKSVMQNLGRGAQGAENIVRLRAEITRQAREAGLSPNQVATKMADFAGRTAAMRSLGTRGVNVEYAANTANKAIDLAEEAYSKLPRTQFVPFNKLRQLYDTNTSSAEQAAAYTATNTLVNEYARVAAGGSNQATEGMRQHAREMLNTAQGPEAFNATLKMMRREIQTAKSAYNETRKEFLSDSHGAENKSGTPANPATSGAPAATPDAVRQNGHTYKRQSDGSYKAID